MSISFSPQQTAVFDWISQGRGSGIVVAVAGAGKTTTLVEALKRTEGHVAFAAYNKAIADEIKEKVAPLGLGNRVNIGTCHSFGLRAWTRSVGQGSRIDGNKMRNLADDLKVPDDFRAFALAAASMAKQMGIGALVPFSSREAWLEMMRHHDLDLQLPEGASVDAEEEGLRWACRLLKRSTEIAVDVIDFDDMIYMPLVKGVRPWQNDWVFLDEAQDTNATRRALARLMLKPRGRLLAVGDPRQAIYGFTGADSSALDRIAADFSACEMPLTTTYRCPKAVVAFAQRWVSHIQAAPSAPEGETETLDASPSDLAAILQPSDAILCRNTKPLVSLAYALIRHQVPCRVEGRGIGEGLMALASRWKLKTLRQLEDRLGTYREREMAKLVAKKRESAAANLEDRVETLLVMIRALPPTAGLDALRDQVERLFSDDQAPNKVTLSTIHRSKGREWERVYWLDRKTLQPSPFARQDWQLLQEDNLCYVAATRAKEKLIDLTLLPERPKE